MEGEVVETIRKSPESMTVAELQAEIGRLQAILHYKVCGDPRHFVSVGAGGVLRGCVCPAGTDPDEPMFTDSLIQSISVRPMSARFSLR